MALIALFATVAVPGPVGSRAPNPAEPVAPDLFQRVEVSEAVRGPEMTIPPLDPEARSAGALDQRSTMLPAGRREGHPGDDADPVDGGLEYPEVGGEGSGQLDREREIASGLGDADPHVQGDDLDRAEGDVRRDGDLDAARWRRQDPLARIDGSMPRSHAPVFALSGGVHRPLLGHGQPRRVDGVRRRGPVHGARCVSLTFEVVAARSVSWHGAQWRPRMRGCA